MSKPRVILYISPNSPTSNSLKAFVAKNIREISRVMYIQIVPVTREMIPTLRNRGITGTPVLDNGARIITDFREIVRELTPAQKLQQRQRLTDDEEIYEYQHSMIGTEEDALRERDDEDEEYLSKDTVKRRMESFQRRRPENLGIESAPKGGRKITASRAPAIEFDSDESFLSHTEHDNIPLPSIDFNDGDTMLEDYYNQEADNSGRKLGKYANPRKPRV